MTSEGHRFSTAYGEARHVTHEKAHAGHYGLKSTYQRGSGASELFISSDAKISINALSLEEDDDEDDDELGEACLRFFDWALAASG